MYQSLTQSSDPIRGSNCPLCSTELVPFLLMFSAASGTQIGSSSPAPPKKDME